MSVVDTNLRRDDGTSQHRSTHHVCVLGSPASALELKVGHTISQVVAISLPDGAVASVPAASPADLPAGYTVQPDNYNYGRGVNLLATDGNYLYVGECCSRALSAPLTLTPEFTLRLWHHHIGAALELSLRAYAWH